MTGTTAKGERARQQILDVAERLFAARGVHGTSVRDVAGELAIPTASLLHHFPRKERLYGAVLQRIAEQLAEVLERGTEGAGDHATKLRRLTRRFWRWSQARPDHCVLLLRDMLDRGAVVEIGHNIGGNQVRLEQEVRFDANKERTRPPIPRWLENMTIALCWPLMGRYGYDVRPASGTSRGSGSPAGGHSRP